MAHGSSLVVTTSVCTYGTRPPGSAYGHARPPRRCCASRHTHAASWRLNTRQYCQNRQIASVGLHLQMHHLMCLPGMSLHDFPSYTACAGVSCVLHSRQPCLCVWGQVWRCLWLPGTRHRGHGCAAAWPLLQFHHGFVRGQQKPVCCSQCIAKCLCSVKFLCTRHLKGTLRHLPVWNGHRLLCSELFGALRVPGV